MGIADEQLVAYELFFFVNLVLLDECGRNRWRRRWRRGRRGLSGNLTDIQRRFRWSVIILWKARRKMSFIFCHSQHPRTHKASSSSDDRRWRDQCRFGLYSFTIVIIILFRGIVIERSMNVRVVFVLFRIIIIEFLKYRSERERDGWMAIDQRSICAYRRCVIRGRESNITGILQLLFFSFSIRPSSARSQAGIFCRFTFALLGVVVVGATGSTRTKESGTWPADCFLYRQTYLARWGQQEQV